MKTHDAIGRARALLDALDQQLSADTDGASEEARERAAVLAFGLTALLDQLGAQAPDNDTQCEPSSNRRPTLSLHEDYPAGPGRRLVVARFCARWFVIEGFVAAPLATYRVDREDAGPFDSAQEARRVAMRRSAAHTGIALWPMQRVVEA